MVKKRLSSGEGIVAVEKSKLEQEEGVKFSWGGKRMVAGEWSGGLVLTWWD